MNRFQEFDVLPHIAARFGRAALLAVAIALGGIASATAAAAENSQDPVAGTATPIAPAAQGDLHWYRGNLHTHSLWSDGNDYPEVIARWFHDAGYNFLVHTEHNILNEGQKWVKASLSDERGGVGGLERYRKLFGSDWVVTRGAGAQLEVRLKTLAEFRAKIEEPGRFLLIQGEEITDNFGKRPVHLNGSNLKAAIRPQGGPSVRETLAANILAVAEQSARTGTPMLVHINHPNYGSALKAEDLAAVGGARFFEVYNAGVDRGDPKAPSVGHLWDVANTIRLAQLGYPPLMGLANDDCHHYFSLSRAGMSAGRGWVWVRAAQLTPEAILAAMKAGDFYASSGVELAALDWSTQDQTLEIVVQPQPGAEYKIEFIGTMSPRENVAAAHIAPSAAVASPAETHLPADIRPEDVGRVLASSSGPRARYKLTGRELYVRAVVTSSLKPANPTYETQRQQAWTQPYGWEKWISTVPHQHKPEGQARGS